MFPDDPSLYLQICYVQEEGFYFAKTEDVVHYIHEQHPQRFPILVHNQSDYGLPDLSGQCLDILG